MKEFNNKITNLSNNSILSYRFFQPVYIFLFVKEGKYTDKIAIEIQRRILNNVLTNKVKYEKLYKLIMICVKPT